MATAKERAKFMRIVSESGVQEDDMALTGLAWERAKELIPDTDMKPSVLSQQVYLAVAASRLLERERCAQLVEREFSGEPGKTVMRALAARIRSGA